jgi:predicted dehydrogenase
MGASLDDSRAMVEAAESGACQYGRLQLYPHAGQPVRPQAYRRGRIGDITWFRGEHTEDFSPTRKPGVLAHRRPMLNGTMGDLAPHMINAALALVGPIRSRDRRDRTVHATAPAARSAMTTTAR